MPHERPVQHQLPMPGALRSMRGDGDGPRAVRTLSTPQARPAVAGSAGLERAEAIRVTDIERIWRYARRRAGVVTGPARPGTGMRAVILALTEDTFYVRELAQHIGYASSAVSRWLRRLEQFGLAEIDFVIQGSTGGRAAEFWTLTDDGREVAEALRVELVSA